MRLLLDQNCSPQCCCLWDGLQIRYLNGSDDDIPHDGDDYDYTYNEQDYLGIYRSSIVLRENIRPTRTKYHVYRWVFCCYLVLILLLLCFNLLFILPLLSCYLFLVSWCPLPT
jgi:hypothetical protein